MPAPHAAGCPVSLYRVQNRVTDYLDVLLGSFPVS